MRNPLVPPIARDQLRILTCGSVDDGKSTLIGRLLHDTGSVPEDQLAACARDSARFGTTGGELDYAFLVDGLEDERRQGITIDVAYRYFASPRRSFVVADAPGHEQYTRNMATGASNAEVAILLVDARKGLLRQTHRHAAIAALMGIRHVVLAVNKIDLVGWDHDVYRGITDAFAAFAQKLGLASIQSIPVCAREGDNVARRSERMPWYRGPTLLEHLETVEVDADLVGKPFRFSVQTILRPDGDTRLYAGTIASGRIAVGDRIVAASSGRAAVVERIVGAGVERPSAGAREAVAIGLAQEIDVARGEIFAPAEEKLHVTEQFAAHVIWMSDRPLLPGRSYLLKIGTRAVPASITTIKYRLSVDTFEHQATRTLELNEIGVCNVATAVPIPVDHFATHRDTGGFLLIDRHSGETLAAGMVDFSLRRGENIHQHMLDVSQRTRAQLKKQRPCILWFTGLSGAGKSTIANRLEGKLAEIGRHTYLLDGDNVRLGLNKDLGFTAADRVENIRRVGEVAKLFVDAGLIVLCSFISPFREERAAVRRLVDDGQFIEIFVDAPLEICAARDPKGLYAKSRRGELPNFTGIDSPYERPENPEIVLDTTSVDADALAARVLAYLATNGYLDAPESALR
jgi:bifunctional enzyme CysN/CysC